MIRSGSFDPTLASVMLARAGLHHRPAELIAEAHDGRWLVRLPARKLVLYESADGDFDVRSTVPGTNEAFSVYAEVRDRPELAAAIGRTIGTMLAEQHARIGAADVAQWLPRRPAWPERREWIRERLPTVVDDRGLIARAGTAIEAGGSSP